MSEEKVMEKDKILQVMEKYRDYFNPKEGLGRAKAAILIWHRTDSGSMY